MIGIDTNILVRFIAQDNPRLYREAHQFLFTNCSRSNPGFINIVVLCELIWVLKTGYRTDRITLGKVVVQLLNTEQLEIERDDLVVQALRDFRRSKADLADCIIGQLNRAAGCDSTVTLDKAASKLDGFELLC